jgi:hypothetical protein
MADEQIDVKIVADASSVKPQTDQVKDAIAAVGAAATGTQKGMASLSAEVRQAAGDAMTLRQSVSNVTPALQGTSGSADQTKSAMTSLMSELSGVYASIAQIPIVGPVLAPAAAAAALYGVIKLGQSIFSARDGIGTVPYDDAPFLLHRNEMVLPANLASPLRAMLQGGSVANGNAPFAANDGGGHSFHYNDYTEKGQSDAQIMAKRLVFAKAVRQAYREGAFAGTPLAF